MDVNIYLKLGFNFDLYLYFFTLYKFDKLSQRPTIHLYSIVWKLPPPSGLYNSQRCNQLTAVISMIFSVWNISL